ncbi:aminotransferase class V-fold PLP-dependent enzyme [Micromonospora sediminicola]|uniref:aminotransferase class V-fold PLP-dependent enzyme n=1 Tax=Micromonospora sediminicola TaxID=946078 RepID=UPI0033DE932B
MTAGAIHLNTAGAGLPAPGVTAAMTGYLDAEAAVGPYEAEQARAVDLTDRVYAALAALVGARPEHIALFASATDAWCRIACHLDVAEGSRIWTTPYEYAGNLIALQRLAARRGCTLEVIPVGDAGDVDLEWMRARLDDRVALVSVVHMPSAVGLIQPVERIGALLAGSSAVYLVDACQTVGQIPVDVGAIGCHALTAAGRKFLRGPRGTGFAYLRPDLWDRIDPVFYDLHVAQAVSLHEHRLDVDTAARFETAERGNAAVLGLLAAAEYARTAPAPAAEVYPALTATIGQTPGTRLLMPGSRHGGIASFTHDRLPPERIRDALAEDGLNTWVGVGAHTPLYLAAAGIERFVRTSVHHYNGVTDIEALGRSLRRVCAA